MATATEPSTSSTSFYDDVENLKKLCDFLRSRQGPPLREALLMEKRVYYLKGEKLVNFLMEPKKGTKWPKDLPRFKSRLGAMAVCKELCGQQFLIRAVKEGKGELRMSPERDFAETGLFVWVYEGNRTMSHLMTSGLIFGFLFCVCFPIWPQFLRVYVWYLSVSLLLFMTSFATIRSLLFLFVWMVGFEFWFLPNLFDENLGFYESFKPLYSFERSKPGQWKYQLGVAIAFFGFCWWAVTQPSEFDGVIKAQGDFLRDLYAGTLISDMAQSDKDDIDKPRMQSLDDLLKSLDEDENEDVFAGGDADLENEEHLDSLLDNLVDQEEEDFDEDEEDDEGEL